MVSSQGCVWGARKTMILSTRGEQNPDLIQEISCGNAKYTSLL